MTRRARRPGTTLTFGKALRLFGPALDAFFRHKAPRLGAALAFYTVFSIPPLLMLLLGVAGQIFGPEAAAGRLESTLSDLVGIVGARAIQDVLRDVHRAHAGLLPTLVGIVTLLAGATAVFVQLKDALDTIWGVEPKPGHAWEVFLRKYLSALLLLLGTGFLLLVSLALNALLAALGDFLGRTLLGGQNLWGALNSVLSLTGITFLFAMMFRFIPDVRVRWKDALAGGSLTAVLFAFGENVIGYYLGRTQVSSAFGITGSVAVLLLWVYYSSMIFLYGAEYTKVFSLRRGERIVPDPETRAVTHEAAAQQGIPELKKN